MSTTFITAEGHIIRSSSLVDEHQIININEKVPDIKNIGTIVKGDTNSNILTFEIKRYYDNVDLFSMDIRFIISNSNGVFTEKAVNLQYNDEFLRFSWILSYAVTSKAGAVRAAIEFFGKNNDGDSYSFKTTPFTLNIVDSLDLGTSESINVTNWYVDFENRLNEIEATLDYETEDIDFSTEY